MPRFLLHPASVVTAEPNLLLSGLRLHWSVHSTEGRRSPLEATACKQGFRTYSDSTHQPKTIHTVVLITDCIDGALLKRAIRQSLSQDVKIVGGALSSSDLAAEGAAKLALRRLERWKEVWRAERVRELLGSVRREGYEE
ncbi:hypothetical protein BKA65DRAFT_553616 [Rhexocercosporidium sp. MPI-PUGE-AT-0058]|nr:hypothetical protein BKA65DRAFT_553616 [Rhexocercosporidium sp. MPI-PUGE-AT-0058]